MARLLPHVESGIAPVDLRSMNGMARADESDGRKSVEGFFTFLYHFVAPLLHTTYSFFLAPVSASFLDVCGISQAEPLAEHPDEYDPYVRSLTPVEGISDLF